VLAERAVSDHKRRFWPACNPLADDG